ncbi:stage V sporulation protein AD [Metallumcola ferriviriculae]|uniref:Stage V sporulation protein AD n=1 Tax=Metallumcola ferriviriculae TaxID=3039180 RepID=A0AAU0US03_9FIRM|nr:stage V sporulation protein AD [Desulfitibacteraceae bacterium MK1]
MAAASIVGPKEGEGPLADSFDKIVQDTYHGEKTWEKAESKLLTESVETVIKKAGLTPQDIDYLLAGDLLNQIISANYAARQLTIPFVGLYGACSTMYEGIALAAMMVDGGYAEKVVVAVSSHHDTAERQYRYPTELGAQRPMTSQWTVTGAGAMLIGKEGSGPKITHATIGKIVDQGIKDANDMGSAMAPAAADTILTHLMDTGRTPEDYDLIVTGDLATVGKALVEKLAQQQNTDLSNNYTDCGILIFDPSQDVHAGGSGCACSAVVTCGYLIEEMMAGKFKRILGVGTGALHSPLSCQQGESIPGIGHAVAFEMQ